MLKDEAKLVLSDPTRFFSYVSGEMPTEYQERILLDESRHVTIRSSRQAGKTFVMAVKVLYNCLINDDFQVLVIGPTQRQAGILFNRITNFILRHSWIASMLVYNSRSYIQFNTGSEIYCLGTADPYSVRGYSPNLVIVDEAAFVREEAFVALEPSLATTGGQLVLVSTPFGKSGRFYDSHARFDYYSKYHVPWTACPFINKEFMANEIASKTDMEIRQEYLAEFIEEADTFFPQELIKNCIRDFTPELKAEDGWDYYLGVDPARYGTDECVFFVVRYQEGLPVEPVYWKAMPKSAGTAVEGVVKNLNEVFDFVGIYFEENALGGPIIDSLREAGVVVHPIVTTLKGKHELYMNFKNLLEKGLLFLPDEGKLVWQMAELQYEVHSSGALKLHHPARPNAHDDWCFCAGTKVLTREGQKNIEDIVVGDLVLTRNGYERVLGVGSRVENVIKRLGLVGTPDHPFITKRGIVKFGFLKVSDTLYIWNEKQSRMEEKGIIDILNQKEEPIGFIIGRTQNIKNAPKLCIAKSIRTILEKFQKGLLCITKMGILSTILQKTLKQLLGQNITKFTAWMREEKNGQEKTLISMRGRKRLNGINLKKEESGTESTGKKLGRIENRCSRSVLSVEKNLRMLPGERVQGFVPRLVDKGRGVRRERVYNLSVEGFNEYFANNILVHNCDSLCFAVSFMNLGSGFSYLGGVADLFDKE